MHGVLAESERSIRWRAVRGVYFYPRSPCGERLRLLTLMLLPCIFLSTLSLRRATLAARDGLTNAIFLSTLSLRRATGYPGGKACAGLFLSTLSLRRATQGTRSFCGRLAISIHALLAESDKNPNGSDLLCGDFYPRSPCGERPFGIFSKSPPLNFYPRSPCGERH